MPKEIRIFYSWQSDLDGKNTRYLIQDAIDIAVKSLKNVVEIVADRDTKGKFGSPNIETVIFDKIKECDIFVADVSIVNKYTAAIEQESISEEEKEECPTQDGENAKSKPQKPIRFSPNPNVLEELGYAAAVIGWDNIICFMNTDYGKKSDLPFDLAQHRISSYSTTEMTKADAKKYMREIIVSHVMDLMENGIRSKGDFAAHIVGGYDYNKRKVLKYLYPLNVRNSEWAQNYKKQILSKAAHLIESISSISLDNNDEINSQSIIEKDDDRVEIVNSRTSKYTGTASLDQDTFKRFEQVYKDAQKPVYIKDDDQIFIRDSIMTYFNMSIDDGFFSLGNLKLSGFKMPLLGEELIGSDDEKRKKEEIDELDFIFLKIQLLENYLCGFEGVALFPLTISNNSQKTDRNLTVAITVNCQNAEIVIPTKELFTQYTTGLEGAVYEEGFITGLLTLPYTSDVSYKTTKKEDIPAPYIPILNPLGYTSEPEPTEEDYEEELQRYIASPVDDNNTFIFEISDLRPRENAYLGIVAVRQLDDKAAVELHYEIKSDYSDGSLEGEAAWSSE